MDDVKEIDEAKVEEDRRLNEQSFHYKNATNALSYKGTLIENKLIEE